MTGRDRVLNAVKGHKTDRSVAAPYMGNYAIRQTGADLSRCQRDAASMASAQFDGWRLFGQDIIVVQSDTYYMAEAFGAQVLYLPNAMPLMNTPLITDDKKALMLEAQDPRSAGRMPSYIEAIRLVREMVGEDAAIRGCGTGPFVVAGHLCGIERLMMWLAETDSGVEDHGEALRHMFSMALETLVHFASAQLEAGATIVQLADSLASINVISPSMYRKYVLPYEKEFFARIAPLCKRYDAISLLHICGDNTAVFDDFAQCGADIVAIDHAASLSNAARIVNNRCCLIGNINPSGLLLSGHPYQVAHEAEVCLDMMQGYRYLLGTGCEVSIETPKENMKAFIETAKTYQGRPI
ncbi:MAG: uroporphyrinogen decarboxylase family protein [Sphaerochaetaceae bacterium]|nr:uroporphyrinogen decarboxylase family protein [Sphaerochaetaceae bacterium]NLO61028.1 hypothetical protein [Spirochaetales bacterium]MDD2406984.1 uroporphyrinogen decarboxylase family protein [Sphaerochaetaceae bacterium]MDD3671730.1 uroporphyrinogen decarboxylase family protein [Sphaerochaetaceae bacterium]MDD4260343.1 uroporphyrinogen decarboxylase family protein [Sphaerochaetaceae bacterium]